ncbi:unnamed protein product [Protopolystoma xenopodis]|uniref:Uncharacterized protein n=1 Tax=Protopolystoma xenopodis TaxID=117903 RepID=A0A448XR50_9PLAT|nr:unnamed protein product [Protopolystoma xenopodis]
MQHILKKTQDNISSFIIDMDNLNWFRSQVANSNLTRECQDETCDSIKRFTSSQPYEFLVTLKRQATGFGFTIVGGAEEGTQVSKFSS